MTMSENAEAIFYEGNGLIRSVASISNISKPVSENIYANGGSKCEEFKYPCFLDDPYEGELFVDLMYLFSTLSPTEKDLLWVAKREKLVSIDLYVAELN